MQHCGLGIAMKVYLSWRMTSGFLLSWDRSGFGPAGCYGLRSVETVVVILWQVVKVAGKQMDRKCKREGKLKEISISDKVCLACNVAAVGSHPRSHTVSWEFHSQQHHSPHHSLRQKHDCIHSSWFQSSPPPLWCLAICAECLLATAAACWATVN